MQVHQVESNSTLQIPLDTINRDLPPNIQDPTETDLGFRNRLIDRLVGCYTFSEIRLGLGFRHVLVVRIARLDFERDVRSDDRGVVAI
jgi:hypothetical protein